MESNLLLDDITFFESDFQNASLGIGREDEDPADYIQLMDENRSQPRRRRVSDYFGNESSEEEEEAASSSDEDPTPRINGIPLNNTGPRTPSHNEIHEQVTNCLKTSKNVLIECPEVMKRRFKILTGVLDYWQWKMGPGPSNDPERADAPSPSVIYYATRDLSESQVVLNELRSHFANSGHLRGMKITILDHRKHLCINEEINTQDGDSIDIACVQMAQGFNYNLYNDSRGLHVEHRPVCEYNYQTPRPHEQLFSFIEENVDFNVVHDIEDLVSNGQFTRQCPYYDTRQIHAEAGFVICPQEFIISPLLRKEYGIELNKAIVIFDDGFDIENVCCKEGSIIVSTSEMENFSEIFRTLSTAIEEGRIRSEPEVTALIQRLPSAIEELRLWVQEQVVESPLHEEILDALSQQDFDAVLIEAVNEALQDARTAPRGDLPHLEVITKLRKFLNVLTLSLQQPHEYLFKLMNLQPPNGRGNVTTTLQIHLANAGVMFAPVESPTISVIVAGSCLAPINNFDLDFGVTFHEKVRIMEDDEGIHQGHLFLYCGKGPNDETFSLNYQVRGDPRTLKEVGHAVLQICQKVPNGVIVVFHTDVYFKKILSCWRTADDGSILRQIQNLKHVVSELDMTTPERTEDLFTRFRELSGVNPTPESPQTGAILLTSRRGKLFHRLASLQGQEKRAIIHVSIPYAAWYLEPLVLTKRFFFEAKLGYSEPQENHDWYESEAFRKLNESFRYSVQDKDWGIVVVLDNRMRSRKHEFNNLLPAWMRGKFRRLSFSSLMQAIDELVDSREVHN